MLSAVLGAAAGGLDEDEGLAGAVGGGVDAGRLVDREGTALVGALWTAGSSRPMSVPMMAILTTSSMSVKPRCSPGRREGRPWVDAC